MMLALAALPLCMAAGSAVDYARAVQTQTVLQAAVDAAALAGASDLEISDAKMKKLIKNYLVANGIEDAVAEITAVNISVNKETGKIGIDVSGKLNTSLMQLAGIPSIEIGARTEVVKGGKALELVLVLDNTGSMSVDGKIDTLKTAATNLVEELMKSEENGVKIGVVPFARYVNVGLASRDQTWLDVPPDKAGVEKCGADYQPQICTPTGNISTWMEDGVKKSAPEQSCVDDLTQPKVKSCWMEGASEWHGCVGSRDGNMDSRIDKITDRYAGLPNLWCTGELTVLTDNKKIVKNAVNNMWTYDSTYIPAGILWGWNVLDGNQPFLSAMSVSEMKIKGGTKAMVIMTDGANTVSPAYPYHNDDASSDKADKKTKELCKSVKAAGIKVYTVAFKIEDADTIEMLRDCASDPGMAYDASNSVALTSAFSDIANKLASTHLTK